jgi:hypothetical protein
VGYQESLRQALKNRVLLSTSLALLTSEAYRLTGARSQDYNPAELPLLAVNPLFGRLLLINPDYAH